MFSLTINKLMIRFLFDRKTADESLQPILYVSRLQKHHLKLLKKCRCILNKSYNQSPTLQRCHFFFHHFKRGAKMSFKQLKRNKRNSFWMQSFHSAFQNESLHLLVLTMDIKAGVKLQQSQGPHQSKALSSKEQERRNWEKNLCSPGLFFFLLQRGTFFFFKAREVKSTGSNILLKFLLSNQKNQRLFFCFFIKSEGSTTAINTTGNQKDTQSELRCVDYQSRSYQTGSALASYVTVLRKNQKRFLLIKSSVARAHTLI